VNNGYVQKSEPVNMSRRIFVKQQGAMRTGTNLVKFALEENFTNVSVLVNIGRWKHATADTPFNWSGTDWEGEGRSVDVLTRINQEELEAVRAACGTEALKYAVSVRNIYSWLESYLKFTHEDETHPLPPLIDLPPELIIEAVEQWNTLYRSYLSLLTDEKRVMLFRLEDLLTNYTATLNRARRLWGLNPRHIRYLKPERYLRLGIDGQSRSELLHPTRSFDQRRYVLNNHLAQLNEPLLELIRQTVDKDVLRAYGYEVL
jgi:hypothetical protein